MSLGERIKQARIAAGLTQQQLGDAISVNKSTIAGYERDGREPDALKLIAIAKVLNVTGDYLLDIEDETRSRQFIVENLSDEAVDFAITFDDFDEERKRLMRGFMAIIKNSNK